MADAGTAPCTLPSACLGNCVGPTMRGIQPHTPCFGTGLWWQGPLATATSVMPHAFMLFSPHPSNALVPPLPRIRSQLPRLLTMGRYPNPCCLMRCVPILVPSSSLRRLPTRSLSALPCPCLPLRSCPALCADCTELHPSLLWHSPALPRLPVSSSLTILTWIPAPHIQAACPRACFCTATDPPALPCTCTSGANPLANVNRSSNFRGRQV